LLTPGHAARLSLPGPSHLSTLTATALPGDPADLAALEDRLLTSYRAVQHFEFLSPARVADLYARHRDLPESVVLDQRALLAAVLCLGRLSELSFEPTKEGGSRMRPIPPGEAREDVTYFRMALSDLDAFGAPSTTALCKSGPTHFRGSRSRSSSPHLLHLSCTPRKSISCSGPISYPCARTAG
jgi:hypothetical protein